ncbi:hypothetical protein [Streptococcus thermophilus]|uniref:mucin-binding protein n=1 Tax=Streptococcus thermophilus TaxID=1308 RepID=UPI00355B7D6D
MSGTTGSKSSYSTSGSIADYKKQGYELVTDGYPADLTFDNDDTTDREFHGSLEASVDASESNGSTNKHKVRQLIQIILMDQSGQKELTRVLLLRQSSELLITWISRLAKLSLSKLLNRLRITVPPLLIK